MDERLNLVLDSEEADRIERLREIIYRQDPVQRARGPLSKSDVARLAMARGLDSLEEHYHVDTRAAAGAEYDGDMDEDAMLRRAAREAAEVE